jgi:hypothetical protein
MPPGPCEADFEATDGLSRQAAMPEFLEQLQSDLGRPVFLEKILSFRFCPNQLHIRSRLVPLEGRIAIVTDAGQDAVDAKGASDEGAARGRPSRVVLTPRRWRQVGEDASHHTGDGGKTARSPGRSRSTP